VNQPIPQPSYLPRAAKTRAFIIFAVAALTLCWPMLQGKFLAGPMSDQLSAGYAYRDFAASYVREYHSIPPWDPYMFGGIAFVGGTHGNIFYPTTWLQWFMPTDTGMNLAFLIHFIIAGFALFLLARALGATWTGAVVGGLGYELTGIVASLVKPGHDGKLFVSALAPLLFLGLWRALRLRRIDGYGMVAIITGLSILGHYQLAYYLLVAGGLWALWLTFLDPAAPNRKGWPLRLGAALAAVLVGVGIAGIQVLPLLDYIPFSPRAAGGPSGGWEYATAYAMPINELMSTVLPQFNGVLGHYWGDNFFKLHTEHIGAVIVLLAAFGLGDARVGRLRWILLGIAIFFLLVSFGGHTPFYRLWYEVMPMMKKVRAPGMAFYLVALMTCLFASFGTDRLLQGRVAMRSLGIGVGILAGLALLGAVGALRPVTETLADPRMMERVVANAGELQGGSIRLLLVVAIAGTVFWLVGSGRIFGGVAAAALAVVTVADGWSIDRLFFDFSPPASVVFADDDLVKAMLAAPLPYRVLDPWGQQVYNHATLMNHRVPQVFGYHGQELRYYDELWGGKGAYTQQVNPNLWDLFAVRFILLQQDQAVPGLHRVAGPVTTAQGTTGFLFELDSVPVYARVVASAAKLPDSVIAATVADSRFPVSDIVLLSDTSGASPAPVAAGSLPPRPAVTVKTTTWRPGLMQFEVQGTLGQPGWLLVGESWFKDWSATVDGKPVPVYRADYAAMAMPLPAGARSITMTFRSPSFERGKWLSLISLLVAGGALLAPLVRRRIADA
jgi:hypothetical protein